MRAGRGKWNSGRRMVFVGSGVAGMLIAVTAVALAGGDEHADRSVVCPRPVIPPVPAQALPAVERELSNLDVLLANANTRLRSAEDDDSNFVRNAILGPLASNRTAALDRIEIAIGRYAARPDGLERFASFGLGQAPAVPEPQVLQSVPTSARPAR